MLRASRRHFFRRNTVVFLCLLIQPWFLCVSAFSKTESLSADAAQAADILGIKEDAERILSLRRNSSISESERRLLHTKRAFVLRRLFEGVLQVQAAENKLEVEMAYAYDVLSREQRKKNTINQFFNALNFAQLSVLYGFIEPYSRIKEQFQQSAIGTSVGSGLAISLPLLNILYNKFSKASHLAPPLFLSNILEGKPVDATNLPPLVANYLDSPVPGSSNNSTRRELLNALWKQRYHADMSKKETLCGIDDNKPKSIFILNSRIELLWSLYTAIQQFDNDLLALLNQVKGTAFADVQLAAPKSNQSIGLGGGADEAAHLLHLQPVIAELRSLDNASGDNERRQDLQISLMESVLSGFLEIQGAADRCQHELNYQYDVVLSQMNARRGNFLQKTYEANFIQTGTLGACAGWSYLNGYSKAGNQLFIVSDAIGLGITTISLLAGHGGWRRNRSEPNSLADFFDLRHSDSYGFSPLVWNYLNSSSPSRTDGKSRRESLLEIWSKQKVTTFNLQNSRNLEKLGSMPSCKWDTINLVVNRIALLSSLREQLQQFDAELLDLLRKAWPANIAADSADASLSSLSPTVNGAAKLLGISGLLAGINNDPGAESSKLLITRMVLEGFLDATADSNILAHEITVESQIANRMARHKDRAIQLTNVANFYQLGILGIVSDSMGLSSISKYVLYADRINIVSGHLIASLALSAFLEQHGGPRLGMAKPNAISAAFGKTSNHTKLSPMMIKYLNTTAPTSRTGLSRREELVKYWKDSKVLNVNLNHDSTVQKLSAEGRAHHWWSETISLINNRTTMLYDLRTVIRTSNIGFDELLRTLNYTQI